MKQNEIKVESINIGLAGPNRIRKWAERILPNGKKIGQLTNSQTVNYKTLKPEIGGLFCERIFGPIKDFECSCGTKKMNSQHKFCANCDVELTASRVRRYRLGYIKLASPVTHIWYLKGRPSFLSLLLNITRKKKKLDRIVYCIYTMGIPLLKFSKDETEKPSDKSILFQQQLVNLPKNIQANSLLNVNLVSKNQFYENNNVLYLKKYLLKNYFISTFKKNSFLNKKIFRSQLTTVLNNSYYSNFNFVTLKSLSRPKYTVFPFIRFLEKKIALQYKSILIQPEIQASLPIASVLNEENKEFKSSRDEPPVALQRKATRGTSNKNFNTLSNNSKFHLSFSYIVSPYRKKKILFLNTKINVEKNLLNKKKIISKYNDKIIFDISNLNNEVLNNLKKNESSKQTIEKSINIVNNSNFSTRTTLALQGKGKSHLKKIPCLIQPYYPICCKFRFASTWESKKDFQDEYDAFVSYISSTPNKTDIVLPTYANRVSKNSVLINNIKYKSTSFLLSGIETIWYLLKTLNLSFVKIQLQGKILIVDPEIKKLEKQVFLYIFEKKKLRKLRKLRLETLRRLKLVRYFQRTKLRPEWIILSILPVLPPNLRPIIRLDANQIAVSDLNHLYKRVFDRNKRIQTYRASRTENFSTNSDEMRFNQRLLQEAVDALIENGKAGTPIACALNGRPFKSLSDILKGKKGRFRQNLLGKRVDYSGRSVIVVEPELRLHECGLPKEMAIELFQPFLIKELRKNRSKTTIIKVKKLIQQKHEIVWKILQKILRAHPILLNRAPTLHRLGIQAFQPKLVDGRAILLHPLVCPAFNADFDGDQMGVHVPLSFQAQAEAWKLMWSRNNILSSATGQPIIVPSQDMILGCYYLTTNVHESLSFSNSHYLKMKHKKVFKKNTNFSLPSNWLSKQDTLSLQNKNEFFRMKSKQQLFNIFSNIDEVLTAFYQKEISLHSLIWVRWINQVQIENFYEKPLEIRIDCFGNSIQIYSQYSSNFDKKCNKISQFIYTTTGRIVLNKIILQTIVKQH